MHFIDQGWRTLNSSPVSNEAKHVSPTQADFVTTSQASIHALTPRMRMLIQCHRLSQRMTTSELSRRVGISHTDLEEIENGKKFPCNATILKLEKCIGVQLVPNAGQ
jgi:ribosome-binding protein aMBF1 (putative translation factor)|tara:strand:+ start:3973 stop:4293 length:321 start_codon:yes stop_codon:yes gene_type:complete